MQPTFNSKKLFQYSAVLAGLISLTACNDDDGKGKIFSPSIPKLTPAVGTTLKGSCPDLSGFQYNDTTITASTLQADGALTVAGHNIAAHCLVTGYMSKRVSPVDNQTYQIGFEMRLPVNWNGRFLYTKAMAVPMV